MQVLRCRPSRQANCYSTLRGMVSLGDRQISHAWLHHRVSNNKAGIPRRRHRHGHGRPREDPRRHVRRAISLSYSCGKFNHTPTFSRRSSRGCRRGIKSVSVSVSVLAPWNASLNWPAGHYAFLYCDEYVCLSVSVCLSAGTFQKPRGRTSPIRVHSDCILVARFCVASWKLVMLSTSGFADTAVYIARVICAFP